MTLNHPFCLMQFTPMAFDVWAYNLAKECGKFVTFRSIKISQRRRRRVGRREVILCAGDVSSFSTEFDFRSSSSSSFFSFFPLVNQESPLEKSSDIQILNLTQNTLGELKGKAFQEANLVNLQRIYLRRGKYS